MKSPHLTHRRSRWCHRTLETGSTGMLHLMIRNDHLRSSSRMARTHLHVARHGTVGNAIHAISLLKPLFALRFPQHSATKQETPLKRVAIRPNIAKPRPKYSRAKFAAGISLGLHPAVLVLACATTSFNCRHAIIHLR